MPAFGTDLAAYPTTPSSWPPGPTAERLTWRRPDDVVGVDVEETDFPWMQDPRPGQAQTAEPAVWIEDILDDLDGRA